VVEASRGKIGTPLDHILLYCYHYDSAAASTSRSDEHQRLAGITVILLALVLVPSGRGKKAILFSGLI